MERERDMKRDKERGMERERERDKEGEGEGEVPTGEAASLIKDAFDFPFTWPRAQVAALCQTQAPVYCGTCLCVMRLWCLLWDLPLCDETVVFTAGPVMRLWWI